MSTSTLKSPRPLPAWLTGPGSALGVAHLAIVGLLALAAPSGPWLMSNGQPSPALGPDFAVKATENAMLPYYLQPLHMNNNYHFVSNRPVELGIRFEVRLKNTLGEVVKTLKFPDEDASFWVRHRQSILAMSLGNDQMVNRGGTQVIPAPGQKMPTIEIWDKTDMQKWRLKTVEEHVLPREMQYDRPTEDAKKLAQTYMRYVCRKHNAASAELIRIHRRQIRPEGLFVPIQAQEYMEIQSHFGEYRREE